ncbi:sll0787 family AIR synthase-like protein [Spongiibacter nanhainus]|uniref:Sll0787 family AIR synthase-like protein n=1 Tax=Spongiibacter nanhainus TaxID=2794344 RepID=A0A7T4UP42_9GAMM|nr:sll0787 family AIR synthase-like protein [Spongiibacter nanhainus]QQD17212.1 sll0787 family AIR synthase-like protein [Spongiibacter nanhainus]
MSLADLVSSVRRYAGIDHKRDIADLAPLMPELPKGFCRNGDDASVIPGGQGWTLLAMEGFITEFVESDPWFAGWCGVMVNVSDIAAMGGRPTAVVNAIWDQGHDSAKLMMQGMADAARTFNVPVVGGHTNLHASGPQLAVAIVGQAEALLSSFAAKDGQTLVAAIDLRGEYRRPYLNWNAATGAEPARLRGDIELLPHIAERGLASAAKDISQAGLLGTLLMLLECSQLGADVDLAAIPRPAGISHSDWLCSFPSFGYVLSCDSRYLPTLLSLFAARGIDAAPIGTLNTSLQLTVREGLEEDLFWDLLEQPLMGLGGKSQAKFQVKSRSQAEGYSPYTAIQTLEDAYPCPL